MSFSGLAERAGSRWFSLLLGLVLLVALALQLDVHRLGELLTGVNGLLLAVAFLFYFVSYLLRALRWLLLLGEGLGLVEWLHIVVLHTVANNLLPFRSGELSFPYFCKTLYGISLDDSIAALLSARVADLFSLGLVGCVALVFVGVMSPWMLLGILLVPACFVLVRFSERLVSFLSRTVFKRDVRIEAISPVRFLLLFFASLLIWFVKFFSFYLMVLSFGKSLGLGYWQVVVASIASEVAAALPIQSLAEFGLFEAGWAGPLMAMGIDRHLAVTLGFAVHLTFLLFSVVMGIPVYALTIIRWRSSRGEDKGGACRVR